MTLWVLCEHGEKDAHSWLSGTGNSLLFIPIVTCPGGRPATFEDVIEALGGEKVWWCLTHETTRTAQDDIDWCRDEHIPHGWSCGWRILTPALDQEKET